MAQRVKVELELEAELAKSLEKMKAGMGARSTAEVIQQAIKAAECLLAIDSGGYTLTATHATAPEKQMQITRGPFEIKLVVIKKR
jgi:hypothetical protein